MNMTSHETQSFMSARISHENMIHQCQQALLMRMFSNFKQIKLTNHATPLRYQKDESFHRLVKDHKECIERMGKDDRFNFGAW